MNVTHWKKKWWKANELKQEVNALKKPHQVDNYPLCSQHKACRELCSDSHASFEGLTPTDAVNPDQAAVLTLPRLSTMKYKKEK